MGGPGSGRKFNVSVERRRKPSLANAEADPFGKFKEDQKFHYRALNLNKTNMRVREAQGWQPIAGSEFGDLILARMPKEDHESRVQNLQEKTERITTAIKEKFIEDAKKHGVETFEEK